MTYDLLLSKLLLFFYYKTNLLRVDKIYVTCPIILGMRRNSVVLLVLR